MRTLTLKQRMMATVIGMMAAAVLIVVFVILPSISEIQSLRERIAVTEKFFEDQYQNTRQLRKSLASIEETATKAVLFDQATIKRGDELALITELETLAEAHHIVQTLTVSPAFEEETVSAKGSAIRLPYYTFTFVNEGTFTDHMRYLSSLEHQPFYLFINHLQWSKPRSVRNTEESLVTVRFDGKVYIKETP